MGLEGDSQRLIKMVGTFRFVLTLTSVGEAGGRHLNRDTCAYSGSSVRLDMVYS